MNPGVRRYDVAQGSHHGGAGQPRASVRRFRAGRVHVESQGALRSSFPRKREPMDVSCHEWPWIPAFVGMTWPSVRSWSRDAPSLAFGVGRNVRVPVGFCSSFPRKREPMDVGTGSGFNPPHATRLRIRQPRGRSSKPPDRAPRATASYPSRRRATAPRTRMLSRTSTSNRTVSVGPTPEAMLATTPSRQGRRMR